MKHKLFRTMRSRLNLSHLTISLVVVVVFSCVFYAYTSGFLIRQETERLETLTQAVMENVESAVRDMDNVSVDLVYIDRARNELERIVSVASTQNADTESWQRYQALQELAGLFVAVNGTNFPVYRVNLYDLDGGCVSVGSGSMVSTGVDTRALPWYQQALDANGYKVLVQPYLGTLTGSASAIPQYLFSVVRLRLDKSRQPIGFVEAIQSCSQVFRSVLTRERGDANIYILNAAGSLVYPFGNSQEALARALELRDGTDTASLARPVVSSYTGWTYIVERPQSEVVAPVQRLMSLILALSLLMAALVVVYASLTSRSITRPLLALANRMADTNAYTLDAADEAIARDNPSEIDMLNDSFTQMRHQLNSSMNELMATRQEALRSRNLAMQAQINPHFYYNTLSSIIALTDAQRPNEVTAMCRALTAMMRYVTDSNPMTTLGEELRYVEKYLYCMALRYESSFSYALGVPEALYGQPMPRLIIQPFVENALKYGIDCAPPWRVQIVGECLPDCWRVWVVDNGPGFSEKARQTILEGMLRLDRSADMPDTGIGGMGVLNVYARWKLFAGNKALFEVGTRSSGGYAMIGMEGGGAR